jgi:GntR family transcriptional regulator, transcriptional repressor for pyruvate dehydrogenase complex
MYTAVKTSRLYQQIVEQIEESVRTGLLKPGDQLPAERELAQQFGVSRTAVREAVRALCEKGLVEAAPGRGTFVIDTTPQSVKQSLDSMLGFGGLEDLAFLEEVREIIEPEIASRAAMRAGEKQLTSMREAIAEMDANAQNSTAFIEADLDFHLALAEAAQNPLVLALIDSIVGLLREQRTRVFLAADGPAHGQFHHRRILDAVEQHDPQAARQAMIDHLTQVSDDSQAGAPAPPEPIIPGS